MTARFRRPPLPTVALAMLSTALALNVVSELRAPDSGNAIAATAMPSPPPEVALAGPGLPPRDVFAETLARPLFNDTRRPRQAAVSEAVVSPADGPAVSLVGIIVSSEGRVAIVRSAGGDKLHRVREGDWMGNLLIARILEDRLIFGNGAGDEIRLYPKKGAELTEGARPAARQTQRPVVLRPQRQAPVR